MERSSCFFDFDALDAEWSDCTPEPCSAEDSEDTSISPHAQNATTSPIEDGDSDETLSEIWPGEILEDFPNGCSSETEELCSRQSGAFESSEKLAEEVPLWEVVVTRVLVRSAPSLDAAPSGICSQREFLAEERDDANPDWVKLADGRGFVLKDGSKKHQSYGMLLQPLQLQNVPAASRAHVSCLLRDAWVEARSQCIFLKPHTIKVLRQAADDLIHGAAGGPDGKLNVGAFADTFASEVQQLLYVEKAAPPAPNPAPGGGVPAIKYQPSSVKGASGRMSIPAVRAMLRNMKQRRLPSREDVVAIITEATSLLERQRSLVQLRVPAKSTLHVVGDIHGQYWDLLHMIEVFGEPSSSNLYLFNGDFVDRGQFSFEVAISLLAMKVAMPCSVHLNRGNHESSRMNAIYGFMAEVKLKYSDEVYSLFCQAFQCLPLATVVNESVFVVHGGLGSCEKIWLSDILRIDRKKEPDEEADQLMLELLWSDPMDGPGLRPSPRGGGVLFGPDVTRRFCEDNGLTCVVRSHEMKPEGFEWHHRQQCLTVFSAPNYCGICGNSGAVCDITPRSGQPRLAHGDLLVRTFEAVDHPE